MDVGQGWEVQPVRAKQVCKLMKHLLSPGRAQRLPERCPDSIGNPGIWVSDKKNRFL